MDKKFENLKRRVIAMLTREQIEHLDKIGMDSQFTTGKKLTRSDILSALVDALIEMEISGKGIKNKKQFVKSILEPNRTIIERRKFPRLKKDILIGFRIADSLQEYKGSIAGNIGSGGFKIEVVEIDAAIALNQVIEITMKQAMEAGSPLKAIGRIVWMRQREDTQRYEIGVKLTYVNQKDQDRFLAYLKNIS